MVCGFAYFVDGVWGCEDVLFRRWCDVDDLCRCEDFWGNGGLLAWREIHSILRIGFEGGFCLASHCLYLPAAVLSQTSSRFLFPESAFVTGL